MAVRRVRRVVRKIDPWTVLKVSFVFNVVGALAFVLGTWVMWSIVVQRGIPQQIADLADNLTVTFTPDGELYFRIVVLLAVVWVVSATALFTLGSVLYNLISDVVGGVEIVVLEETYNLRAPVAQPVPNNVRPAVHQRATATIEPVPDRVPARASRGG